MEKAHGSSPYLVRRQGLGIPAGHLQGGLTVTSNVNDGARRTEGNTFSMKQSFKLGRVGRDLMAMAKVGHETYLADGVVLSANRNEGPRGCGQKEPSTKMKSSSRGQEQSNRGR